MFFFEHFCAARFRLRGCAAPSSGRVNQKTLAPGGMGVSHATTKKRRQTLGRQTFATLLSTTFMGAALIALPSKASPPKHVTIDNGNNIFLDGIPVTITELKVDLQKDKKNDPGLNVLVTGDGQEKYQTVMQVMNICDQLRVCNGLATRPIIHPGKPVNNE
jgi:hypothetical protein